MDQHGPTRQSVPPPGLRNVRLRLFLGPTNLGILRDAEEVMAQHPVIVHQHGYRFDVYGRPLAVADAITETLLDSDRLESTYKQHTQEVAQQPCTPDSHASGAHWGMEAEESESGGRTNTTAQDSEVPFRTRFLDGADVKDIPERSTEVEEMPFSSCEHPQYNQVKLQEAKTDYDMARKLGVGMSKINLGTNAAKPWSLSVILSMPERLAFFLLHLTGAFVSYLVEEESLKSCACKSYSPGELQSIRESAGVKVGVSKVKMIRSDEMLLWLAVGDMRALRAILSGITRALVTDPVYSLEAEWADRAELDRRTAWDLQLDQYKGPRRNEDCDDGWVTSKEMDKQQLDEDPVWGGWGKSVGGHGLDVQRDMVLDFEEEQDDHEDHWEQSSFQSATSISMPAAYSNIVPQSYSSLHHQSRRVNDGLDQRRLRSKRPSLNTPEDFARSSSQSVLSFFAGEEPIGRNHHEQSWDKDRNTSPGSGRHTSWGMPQNRHRSRSQDRWNMPDGEGINGRGGSHSSGRTIEVPAERMPHSSLSDPPSPTASFIESIPAVWKVFGVDTDTDPDEVSKVAEWATPFVMEQVRGWQKGMRSAPKKDRQQDERTPPRQRQWHQPLR